MAFEAEPAVVPIDRTQMEELENLLPIELGLFGGSGNYDPGAIENPIEVKVFTPYGAPSDNFILGTVKGRKLAFLARHGRNHALPPHAINYRANVWGMKSLGVSRIISPCACGSLQPDKIDLGEFVFCDQIFDRTFGRREDTFFDGGPIAHLPFSHPYCPEMRKVAIDVAKGLGYKIHETGTYVCINGPRFSTVAESVFFHNQGFDVIGMTAYPESPLAREAGICFLTIAMPTDKDVHGDSPVTHELVLQTMANNIERVRKLTYELIPKIPTKPTCSCQTEMKGALF